MKFILYRYKETPYGSVLQYVKEIKNGKVLYSTRSKEARRFPLMKSICLAIKFRLTWINEKYIAQNS